MRVGLSAGLALFAASAIQGSVVYVHAGGAPGGDGTSWETCCRFLQEALAIAAVPANGVTEIHVAQGTYRPDRHEVSPGGTGDRTVSFQLINGVALYGGYAGPDEADPDVRDIDLYVSVLSGDLLGDDGPDFANNAENSWHVVTGSGTDSTAVIQGFTITAGNADGPTYPPEPHSGGGGMLNHAGSPTVDRCTFFANWAVQGCAGLFNFEGSSPLVTDCVFDSNETLPTIDGSPGAGLCNVFDSNATVSNCLFVNNAAGWGAGMLNQESSPEIIDCEFTTNDAYVAAGMYNYYITSDATITGCTFTGNTAIDGYGGGMQNVESSPTISDCTFSDNVANYGAGMRNYSSAPIITNSSFISNDAAAQGGGMQNWNSSPTIDLCAFDRNTGVGGGGMRNAGTSSPTVTRSSFVDNTVFGYGGALSNQGTGVVSLEACVISGNHANFAGGAAWQVSSAVLANCLVTGNTAGNYGGAMDVYNGGDMTLVNCTLVQNEAQFSGDSIRISLSASGRVVNSILRNPGDEITVDGTSIVDVSYSDVEGGYVGDGNIDADPLFVDPVNGDYHLASGSPANDAGHNWAIAALAATDLDGNPRFADDPAAPDTGCGVPVIVDMGVYEYQGTPFEVQYADLDGDGIVGINDFLDVLAAWGPCPEACCLADLDLDGNVGINDFLDVLANWD